MSEDEVELPQVLRKKSKERRAGFPFSRLE